LLSPSTRAPEDQLVKKPANLTFELAAAVGVSASTALQLLRDDAKVKPRQKVLINGASGGSGHSLCRSPRRSAPR
jgi:NADPH:quinone reductase-like Zn-dependent oxidoreductase